uniref:Uncharacterized protein n=1 Tax=Rhizophora mucronata TaxID=61149 RepID=A0A2P2N382_RHIMU
MLQFLFVLKLKHYAFPVLDSVSDFVLLYE